MLPIVSQELGKACFNVIMSQTTEVEQGAVALVDCALQENVRGTVALGETVHKGWLG